MTHMEKFLWSASRPLHSVASLHASESNVPKNAVYMLAKDPRLEAAKCLGQRQACFGQVLEHCFLNAKKC
jgi:hypothetical protein